MTLITIRFVTCYQLLIDANAETEFNLGLTDILRETRRTSKMLRLIINLKKKLSLIFGLNVNFLIVLF